MHKRPFGLIEGVFVNEKYRSRGIGTNLVQTIIKEAKKKKCYKIILTCRYTKPKVHKLYKKLVMTWNFG